jgi:hypothetical protein
LRSATPPASTAVTGPCSQRCSPTTACWTKAKSASGTARRRSRRSCGPRTPWPGTPCTGSATSPSNSTATADAWSATGASAAAGDRGKACRDSPPRQPKANGVLTDFLSDALALEPVRLNFRAYLGTHVARRSMAPVPAEPARAQVRPPSRLTHDAALFCPRGGDAIAATRRRSIDTKTFDINHSPSTGTGCTCAP